MKKVLITLIIGLVAYLASYAQSDPNSVDPNTIKLPEGVKAPMQLKCPFHGLIGKAFIAIEANGNTKAYCSQCAKHLICRFFDENLPKLEVVK